MKHKMQIIAVMVVVLLIAISKSLCTTEAKIIYDVQFPGTEHVVYFYDGAGTLKIFNKDSQLQETIDLSKKNYDSWSQFWDENGLVKSVTCVEFVNDIYITGDISYFFSFPKLNSIDGFEKVHFSNITNMRGLFAECQYMKKLDVSNIDTCNVTNMSGIFKNCGRLSEVDVSEFDTSKVLDMKEMFYGCKSLNSLDISNFDTSRVKHMEYMFYNCPKLSSLDFRGFDTGDVTSMSHMFAQCSLLDKLDLSSFDTSNVTDVSYMFADCPLLTTLNVNSFDTSRVNQWEDIFGEQSNIQTMYTPKTKWLIPPTAQNLYYVDEDKVVYQNFSPDYSNYATDISKQTKLELVDKEYTIEFVSLEGGVMSKSLMKYHVAKGVEDLDSVNSVDKAHYIFGGWYRDREYTVKADSIPVGEYGNMTLYAKLSPEEYDIIYHLNEGELEKASYVYGIETELERFVVDGYDFEGWYADESYTKPIEMIGKTEFGEIHLYGKYTDNHKLTKCVNEIEPTCAADGYTGDVVCAVCGMHVADGCRIDAAHKWNLVYTVDVPATDQSVGVKSIHCVVCDERKDEMVIPKVEKEEDASGDEQEEIKQPEESEQEEIKQPEESEQEEIKQPEESEQEEIKQPEESKKEEINKPEENKPEESKQENIEKQEQDYLQDQVSSLDANQRQEDSKTANYVKKSKIKKVKVKNIRTRKIRISFAFLAGCDGYEILISSGKKFSVKTTTVLRTKGYAANGYVVRKCGKKGIKKNKVYYVKIRPYSVIGEGRVYGKYSSVKCVKIKK